MTDSEWTTEPAIYDLTTVPANGSSRKPQKEKISVIDAYAQWKMGPDLGLPYDVANQERLEQQDGSLVVSQIEEIGKRGPPKQIVPEVIQIDRLVRTDPSDGSGSLEDDGGNSGSDIAYGDVLLPLPLRQTSVAKSMTSPRSGWFEVPDGVSPEEVVVVGIIDDAINVAHERFRDAQGRSRVDFAWIQDAVASDKGEPFRDSYVPYGREWRRRDIDAAKDFYGDNEEAIWRDLQMITDGVDYRQSTLRLRRSHGTHVADLAAGCDGEELSAINKRIITVQLPVLATQDTSGAALIAVIRDAALFIYQRAEIMSRELKVPVPVILNISYGIAGGARDGKHILVRSLQEIAKRYRENVKKKKQIPKKKRFAPAALTVLPAGNGHLARGHAQSLKGSPDELKLRLRLQPQDQTSSHLEIWFPESTGEIEIEIRPPSVASRKITYCELTPGDGEAALKREALVLKVDEQAICRVTIDEPSEVLPGAVPTLHWRVLISFAPTLSYDGYPVAPQGEWRIHAKTSDGSGPISTWISRDESLADFPKLGRQAYFEDEVHDSSLHDMLGDIAVGETPASSVICRNMTISGISSKTRGKSPRTSPIVVGANFWDNHHAVPYTAAGGVLGGLFAEGPVVSASADTSRALPGILAAGNRSGVTVSQNGTSVAVPQTVRWLAEYLRCKSAKERSKLDARKLLQKKFGSDEHQPPRPTADRPELLTQPEIREQRLKGGFLPVHKDHEYGISRKVYAKQ